MGVAALASHVTVNSLASITVPGSVIFNPDGATGMRGDNHYSIDLQQSKTNCALPIWGAMLGKANKTFIPRESTFFREKIHGMAM